MQLWKQGIDEFPAFLASPGNKAHIVGGDHNARKFPDVLWEPLISYFIQRKFLAVILTQNANEPRGIIIILKISFYAKPGRPVLNTLHIGAAKAAFRETQIIDRIQQIGFATPVVAINTDDILVESKLMKAIAAKLC